MPAQQQKTQVHREHAQLLPNQALLRRPGARLRVSRCCLPGEHAAAGCLYTMLVKRTDTCRGVCAQCHTLCIVPLTALTAQAPGRRRAQSGAAGGAGAGPAWLCHLAGAVSRRCVLCPAPARPRRWRALLRVAHQLSGTDRARCGAAVRAPDR